MIDLRTRVNLREHEAVQNMHRLTCNMLSSMPFVLALQRSDGFVYIDNILPLVWRLQWLQLRIKQVTVLALMALWFRQMREAEVEAQGANELTDVSRNTNKLMKLMDA